MPAACPDPRDANIVYLMRGPELTALDLRTLAMRRIGSVPKPHLGGFGQPTLDKNGRFATVSKQRDARTWEIGLIDMRSGEYRTEILA